MKCDDPQHETYPGNCPGCNPEGYAALLASAPQGQFSEPEADMRPTRRKGRAGAHDLPYTDRY